MPKADPHSSSKQEQQQPPQSFTYPYSHPQQLENEAIDLYELWLTIWNWKWLVIVITLFTAIGAILYAMQLQHIYKSEALLLPPKLKDIQLLNVLGIQIKAREIKDTTRFSIEDVFNNFKKNLKSRKIHKKFIQEKGLMEFLDPDSTAQNRNGVVYDSFARLFKLEDAGSGTTSLSIELNDPEIAAQWVNDLIEFVDKETITLLVDDIQNSISNQARDIEYAISSKRDVARHRREDLIKRYEEAAIIAKELGVMDRVDSTNIVQNNQLNITTTNVPLYFRGFRALSEEIVSLKKRKSDDPFITGLRDLQEQLILLRSYTFDKEKLSAVHVDRAAYPPKSAIKPNRRLLVSLATVVGLFSGIFLAFLIEFVIKSRHKKNYSV